MSYIITGPISYGSRVIIIARFGGELYALNSYTDKNNKVQVFLDSNVIPLFGDPSTLPVFLLGGSTPNIQLNSTGIGGLGYDGNNDAILQADGAFLSPSSTYASWGGNNPLLASIPYSLLTPSNAKVIFNLGDSSSGTPKMTGTTTDIVFMPIVWYFGCSGSQPGLENSDAGQTIQAAYCGTTNDPSNCTSVQTQGWSTLQGCEEGVVYAYCTSGNYCSKACWGPCQSQYDECTYDPSTGGGICAFDINDLFSGSWWKSTWFLSTSGILLAIIVLIVLVLYFKSQR